MKSCMHSQGEFMHKKLRGRLCSSIPHVFLFCSDTAQAGYLCAAPDLREAGRTAEALAGRGRYQTQVGPSLHLLLRIRDALLETGE